MDASQSPANEPPHQFLQLSAYAQTNSLFPPPPLTDAFDPPASGIRIPLHGDRPLPPLSQLGPPAYKTRGREPLWLGSAFFKGVVHPCVIAPHLDPPCRVPWGGAEHGHRGRFDVLIVDERAMEWVPARAGYVQQGRRPLEGGYEQRGPLHHARARVSGVLALGKSGVHLPGGNVLSGGREVWVTQGQYEVLCWREGEA